MSNDSVSEVAEELHEQYADDETVAEIEEQLVELKGFDIPLREAKRTVRARLSDDGSQTSGNAGEAPERVDAASVNSDDEWVTIEGEVVDLWDTSSDSIAQTGLIADDSGSIKFTLWAKSADALPTLEEGEAYRFESVVTDEYNGRYSVNLNSATEVQAIDESFEEDPTTSVSGALVSVKDNSGLIERCPEEDCTRPLSNGRCADHGAVEGDLDLRIKAVLDDGTETYNLIFDAEMTEELTGIGMEDAKALATDALDRTVVEEKFRDMLAGQYLQVEAEQVYQYHMVDSIEEVAAVADPEAVLIRGRAMAVTEDALAEAQS